MKSGFKHFYNHLAVNVGNTLSRTRNRLRIRNSDVRRQLDEVFSRRERIFFRKKKPNAAAYPYVIHDPYEIFGDNARFGDFNLIGQNWTDGTEKPIALLWGFNNWKWGFVADYLHDYRVAIAPRKMLPWVSLLAIWRFPVKPACFVFWGYTEPSSVLKYATKNSVPILRMEDGFIRSSSLGASHSTPYSLVIDKTGLHYSPDTPSDLEILLNEHEFTATEVKDAEHCMSLMQSMSLSKYNPPIFSENMGGALALRRKVAVIGQVDNDMAMRLGNPENWTMLQLIRLAKHENPDAEIIYRPHPDIFQGYQRSRFQSRPVAAICRIESPDVPITEFLDGIDHLYTVTSLTGLEALLRGKTVTVVGAAFYAGWGLTDDRLPFPRRTRKRTLKELFSAVYLKYPTYLADRENARIGFHSACLRISADRVVDAFDQTRKVDASNPAALKSLMRSNYWPHLMYKSAGDYFDSSVKDIDWIPYLGNRPGRLYQSFMLHAICGKLTTNGARDVFLTQVRKYIDLDLFAEFLLNLGIHAPGTYVTRQTAWLLTESSEFDIAQQILVNRLKKAAAQQARISDDAQPTDFESEDSATKVVESSAELSDDQRQMLSELLDLHIKNKEFGAAAATAYRLALSGHGIINLALKISRVAEATFDIKSARDLAFFCRHADLYAENRRAIALYLSNLPTDAKDYPELQMQQDVALELRLNPERINNGFTLSRQYSEDRNYLDRIIESMLALDNEQSVQKAMAYLEVDRPGRALEILTQIIASEGDSDRVRVAYAKALIALGSFDKALGVLDGARANQASESSYKETLRLLSFMGRYAEAEHVIADAETKRISIGDAFIMPTHLAMGRIEVGYKCYLNVPFRDQLIRYFGERYLVDESLENVSDLLIMAVYGPGDEIRFASMYEEFARKFSYENFRVTCDYRLERILSRSFPSIEFVPVRRVRDFSSTYPREMFDKLPGAELCVMLDNSGLEWVEKSNKVVMVTDLIWQFRKNKADFPGRAFLKHDETLASQFQVRLDPERRHVGICWRSSLTTHSRSVNYLAVEELGPLLSLPDIQFVNFQYDECDAELAWIEENYPGKIIDFSDIDHYNDFDAVAALMKCMDAVIAPATSVAELSAALGCPTLLFAGSAEIEWRIIDEIGTDIWQASASIVVGKNRGDKVSLVQELKDRLEGVLHRSGREN